jgi:hypothetical protein
MPNRFKDPDLRKVYDGFFAAAKDPSSFLYKDGQPHRGSTPRCAFWDGYNGNPNNLFPKGSQSYAAFRAGQDFAKTSSRTLP